MSLKKGSKVLDLGCGNGRLIKVLEKYDIEYVGLDISDELVKFAKKSFPKHKFIVSDLVTTPFKENEFDAVLSVATLHHIPGGKRAKALEEANRVLKPGGKALISIWYFWNKPEFLKEIFAEFLKKLTGKSRLDFGDFYKDWGNGKSKVTERYFHAWTKRELKKRLGKAGFKRIDFASYEQVEEKRNLIVIAKK